jgi:hypothetical protein
MKLRGKLSFWVSIFLVLAATFFIVPAVSGQSWLDMVDEWLDEYQEAVEQAQEDDDDDDEHEGALPVGDRTVVLDEETSEYSGIETITLQQSSYFPESKAYAQVVDVSVLLDLRSQYQQASAALNVARVKERSAAQELARLKKLSQGAGSVATKNVNYAEAAWRETRAKLQGFKFQLQDVEAKTKQTWGTTIAAWVLELKSIQLNRLLTYQDSLLLVTLGADQTLPEDVTVIQLARDGARQHARKAYFVALAMIPAQRTQGETYFFRTSTGKLRSGMRVDVWVPETNEPISGVFIPDEAVVWYAGQAWTYVEVDKGTYQRHSLKESLNVDGGLFMQQDLSSGDNLVLTGSQMLLSEEFKWQIQDEDDD